MPLHPYASIGFLSGSGLSTFGAEGQRWLNVDAVLPGVGLWNPNPPNAFTTPNPPLGGNNSTPNPPHSSNTTPNPPAGAPNALLLAGIPNPPQVPRWPRPTQAPPPRVGVDPDWVYANPASMLAQALKRSAARVEGSQAGKVSAKQIAEAQVKGTKAQNSHLWRWGSEFRARAVCAELLGRLQVVGCSIWLLDTARPTGMAAPHLVYALPGDLRTAGVKMPEQVDKVLRAAVEREERTPEILSQMNDFWPFFESITGLALERAPRTAELLTAAHDWLLHPLMLLKHQVALQRPVQTSSLIVPMIPTPGHGSLPSGHATQAAFTSELLHILLYEGRGVASPALQRRSEQLDRLARRIAFNRVVAGVHFPVDSLAGYRLGTQMARLMTALAGDPAGLPSSLAEVDVLDGFELPELGGARAPRSPAPYQTRRCPLLHELWATVTHELDSLAI